MEMRYINSVERIIRQKERDEGREEGRVEGRVEERVEVARRMLKEGLDQATIIRLTGLTDVELVELARETS
jgi:predicted transposase/invertase (TIGR01784 family)